MSDYEYDDDYDHDDNSGGALRKQLEQALAKVKRAEERASKAEFEIAQSKATAELTAKGYPPAVARLAAKDGVDIGNKEALDDWLAINGDVFVKPSGEPQHQEQKQEQEPVAETIPDGLEAAYRHVGTIHAAASPASVNQMQAALASIPEDATKEQVAATLRSLGL